MSEYVRSQSKGCQDHVQDRQEGKLMIKVWVDTFNMMSTVSGLPYNHPSQVFRHLYNAGVEDVSDVVQAEGGLVCVFRNQDEADRFIFQVNRWNGSKPAKHVGRES